MQSAKTGTGASGEIIKAAPARIERNRLASAHVSIPAATATVDPTCVALNPANSVHQDACALAQPVGTGVTYSGFLFGATADGTSTCDSSGSTPDAWFRYTASADGTLAVTLAGNGSFGPVISAHTASPGTAANEIACQSDPASAVITIPVTNRATIFLRIAFPSDFFGSYQMTLTGTDCLNVDQNNNGIVDACESDYGDAPAPYPTLLADNGASHFASSGLFLGSVIDAESDGQPSAQATGDNLNGQPNDEDGVTFTSALTVGQTANLQVVASGPGLLNAWLDFNADGDWADAGEQIFLDQALAAGVNLLSFAVPAGATPTALTFARFRLSSTAGLSFTGFAADGEVEDYAVEILSATPTPSGVEVRINEVMAGLNGDSSIQFVELEANGSTHKVWGPHGTETAGRAMLVFFDEAGNQTGRFVFPHDAPNGANTVLVATQDFADVTGVTPDFILPKEIMAIRGKVAFRNNPDNTQFSINIALAYGGNGYFGPTDGAGPANVNELPILGAQSLTRVQNVAFGLNQNTAFQLATPSPVNTANQSPVLVAASLTAQGQNLFFRETFNGNGRTCFTCHLPQDQFGLTPATINSLAASDPLFANEFNVNTLVLTAISQPGDLRGTISGAAGSARILAGTGNRYLVLGGNNLSGAVTDAHGNSGVFQSFTAGDLNGPTASNGSSRGLEDSTKLRGSRGLVLENLDGFQSLEVFRASPHLLNVGQTAPFGLSGEFANLDLFCAQAVRQHFPRSLARVPGVDFRPPNATELQAMTAFMNSIVSPADQDFTLARFVTTEAQKRGSNIFFSAQGQCFQCHSGPVLAHSAADVFAFSIAGNNDSFDTGVANQTINATDGLPTEPPGGAPGQSTRRFSTPPLFGVKLTAPFFHDNSAGSLAEVVQFYGTSEFNNSPAGAVVGTIPAASDPQMTADLVAFLESLVDIPASFTRQLDFGAHGLADLPTPTMTASVTNSSPNPVTITQVVIDGTDAADFSIVSGANAGVLAPGQVRAIVVNLTPTTAGTKSAALEITADDGQALGTFSFGVALAANVNSVAGRFVFYNNSAFDGNNALANANDDAAIATNKTALLPGHTASFANYTSYSRGLNGIIVDLANPPGPLTLADFDFKIGNNNTVGSWTGATTPSIISIRPGSGVNGSWRVTLIWPDNAIQKQWLQVTVKATAATGLGSPDVFYFGNAIGETGDSTSLARVQPNDEVRARNNQRSVFNPAPLNFDFDFNRDGLVNGTDQIIVRANGTTVFNELKLIAVP